MPSPISLAAYRHRLITERALAALAADKPREAPKPVQPVFIAAEAGKACKRLGVTWSSVYLRAKATQELRDLYRKAKAVSGPVGSAHPGLRDMTGQRFGVLEVVRRAANQDNGNAAWVCVCGNCGAEEVYQGIALRARRAEAFKWCRQCRPAQPGTVTRVAKEPVHGR